MDAILRSNGVFTIRHQGASTTGVAVQTSRNLFQYFAADAVIVNNLDYDARFDGGNLITLAMGTPPPAAQLGQFPVHVTDTMTVVLRDRQGLQKEYSDEDGIGAIFVRPLPNERLELVVWGSDSKAIAMAARLMPMLTGVGQPDFVVLGSRCRMKGVDGTLAMGFFDHTWNLTITSFLA